MPLELLKEMRVQLEDSIRIRNQILREGSMMEWIIQLSHEIVACLSGSGKVIFAGNGGSFADAQHITAEFVGRFMIEREPLSALCLGTNSSIMTCVANDYSFDNIFARELKSVASPNDIFIAISTSGNSMNLINAIAVAKEMGLSVSALLGKDGGKIASENNCFIVPSSHTARIQEVHITLGHFICDFVDRIMLQPHQ